MIDYRRFKEINELFSTGQNEKAKHLLMEMQSRWIALKDEIDRLKIRVQTFEDILYLAKNLYKEKDFYWLRTAGVKQGPFCPHCYETEGGLIRLEKTRSGILCPYCQTHYKSNTKPEDIIPIQITGKQARILPFAK